MIHLDLSHSFFSSQVPIELSYLSKLVSLDLSFNYDLKLETSSWKRIVGNLSSLRELCVRSVNMSYISPNSFKNLSTSLMHLGLSESGLQGEFPENVFNLPNLQAIDLSYNSDLYRSFPQYNWSSPLENLNLSYSRFLIDLPHLTRNLKYLTTLSLRACSFVHSEIPRSSLNLQQLIDLDLSSNNFTGQLPEICSNSTGVSSSCVSSTFQLVDPLPLNLKYLKLSLNELNGTIPSWLHSLPSLQYLDLANNHFTGCIHDFQYNSLVCLDLGYNKLQGLFPSSIFQQVNLSVIFLSSNNFSGIVSFNQFSKLKNLKYLDLSYNSFSFESINNEALPNTLLSLSLSLCGISEFPYSLRSAENLESLELSYNQIKGIVPSWL